MAEPRRNRRFEHPSRPALEQLVNAHVENLTAAALLHAVIRELEDGLEAIASGRASGHERADAASALSTARAIAQESVRWAA
jgi:hypothetical protein